MKPISNVFLTHTAEILAETQKGLTATQIAKYFVAKSLDYQVDIPHYKAPFVDVPNKRTAFLENLQQFNSGQQFEIIDELTTIYSEIPEVNNLKNKLHEQYPDYSSKAEKLYNVELVEETKHWLEPYNKAYTLYKSALEKLEHGNLQRNLIDDLRLSLELLLKELLGNEKSLENQIADIGTFQKNKGISTEASNMFNTLLNYYTKYQNKYVKHDDNVNEKEIEFIVDLTSSFIKFITKK